MSPRDQDDVDARAAELEARFRRAMDFAKRNRLVYFARETESGRLTVRDPVAPWLEAFAEEEIEFQRRHHREDVEPERSISERPKRETDRGTSGTSDRPVRDGQRRRR